MSIDQEVKVERPLLIGNIDPTWVNPESRVVPNLLSDIVKRLQLAHPGTTNRSQEDIEDEIKRVRIFNRVNDYYDYIEQTTEFKYSKRERLIQKLSSITVKGVYSQYQDKENKTQRVILILGKKNFERHILHELTHAGQSILGIEDFSKRDPRYDSKLRRTNLGVEILICSLAGLGVVIKLRPEDILPEKLLAAAGIIGMSALMQGQYSYEDTRYEKEANEIAGLIEK